MAPEGRTILTEQKGDSEIVEFYRGKTVFITGGTGFLGKVLIEILLRCCPDIKRIYLLCRPKKGKTIEERMALQLCEPLYDYIKKTKPEVLSKIVALPGEHTKPYLGMSEGDLNTIVNETNIIFHMAATIRFDEELRQAVAINVKSTKDILFLARQMSNLAAFVHVSTAYANCIYKEIKEEFYKPPIDGDRLIEMVEGLSDEMLLRITPGMIGEYPNTYTFTKCVAEDLVKKYSAGLPIAIVRPSIVTPLYNGPCPGWTDNINGPVGLGMGLGLGVLHVLQTREDLAAEFIPVDFVMNGIIAVAWNVGKNTPTHLAGDSVSHKIGGLDIADSQSISANESSVVEIYHTVAAENPMSWGTGIRLIVEYGLREPSHHLIWMPFYTLVENKYLFNILMWLLHWFPAYIGDTLLKLLGKKPMLVKIYTKAEKFQAAQKYFTTNEWTISTNNMRRLIEKLSDVDKKIFTVDVKELVWKKHVDMNCDGIRKFILKENMEPAYTKLRVLTIAHYTVCALLLFLLFKLLKPLFY